MSDYSHALMFGKTYDSLTTYNSIAIVDSLIKQKFYQLQLLPQLHVINNIIINDVKINTYPQDIRAVYHGDFIYFKNTAILRAESDIEPYHTLINLSFEDFDDPKTFIKESYIYHDKYSVYNPLLVFLRHVTRWVSQNYSEIKFRSVLNYLLPTQLKLTLYASDTHAYTTVDFAKADEFKLAYAKQFKAIDKYIFIGTL